MRPTARLRAALSLFVVTAAPPSVAWEISVIVPTAAGGRSPRSTDSGRSPDP